MESDFLLKFGVVIFLGLLCFVRRSSSSAKRDASLSAFLTDDRGGVFALDFILTTMWYFPVVMCTIQFFMAINAYLFVKYAAFSAARSASVIIPEEISGETYNEFRKGRKKHELILESAILAVSPVSPMTETLAGFPQLSGATKPDEARGIGTATTSILLTQGRSPHARYDIWPLKYWNACTQTSVEILEARNRTHSFKPGDAVTVEVTYRFHLSWPLADEILRDRWSFGFGGNYRTLSARCTMINEGWADRPSRFKRYSPSPSTGFWSFLGIN